MATEVGQLLVKLGADTTSFVSALAGAQRQLFTFSTATKRVFGLATLAVGGGIGAMLDKAGDYETEMNVLQAVTEATGGPMARLGAKAKALGADITLPSVSAADAAQAMTELAKGGLSVTEILAASKGVLQLAAAAHISNADAAKIAARSLSAFELSGNQAIRVADLLAAAANATTVEMSDIALGMQMASASAHQLGVPIEDLTAAIGLMADAGVVGSDAGTSLKTMFVNLYPETDKQRKAFRELGLLTAKGNSAFYDAKGQFIGMHDAIALFTSATERLTPLQKQMAINTIFGRDASRAANIVLAASAEKFDLLKDAVMRQDAASEMATARTKGFKGSIDAFKSSVETLAIQFGEHLLPAATEAMKKLSEWAGKIGEHETEIVTVVTNIKERIADVLNIADQVVQKIGGWSNVIKVALGLFAAAKLGKLLSKLTSLSNSTSGLLGNLGTLGKAAPTVDVKGAALATTAATSGKLLGNLSKVAGMGAIAISLSGVAGDNGLLAAAGAASMLFSNIKGLRGLGMVAIPVTIAVQNWDAIKDSITGFFRGIGLGGGTEFKTEAEFRSAPQWAQRGILAKMKEADRIFGRSASEWRTELGLQHGGIVTRPTLALLGEAGPEAVVPLGRMGGASVVNVYVAGSVVSERDLAVSVAEQLRRLSRGGVGPLWSTSPGVAA